MAEAMDFKQSIRDQTHVSTTLAAHLLSKKHDSNVVFSPVSIHAVLSLLAQGTTGRTRDQLLAFLKTNTTHNLNSLYSQYVSSIFGDSSSTDGPRLSSIFGDSSSSDGPRLSIANGVWVDKTLSLKPSFKQVVDDVYKAVCKQVDFQTKAAEVVDEVNLWAERQTNGLIKELLHADEVSSLTRLIFANALYFKGTWRDPFDREATIESDFHLLGGNKVQVPFMTDNEFKFVCEYDDFKVLGLPYLRGQERREFTMYFFLPNAKDGLQSLVQKIGSTSDFLDSHIRGQQVEVGRFLLPKFKIEFRFKVCDMLMELGLVLPFTGEDGLTEMADSSAGERLHVSSIHQKSFMEVNEEGTEAAAVTYEQCYGCASDEEEPRRVDFVADHPFLFVIREDVTGVVLFVGQVIDPSVG
ncbi:putative Serpin family protein [Helianthus annuus]|nr:putative Serpin family protein [Helianthus annuus]KAJ0952171.1 putative Serpin family protein [Helianthus annuus]